MSERLNVVDEQGVVIGEETRQKIHEQGLLHREVHVWFVTPRRGIIFQRRADNKDTYPGLLDATVGGHVEIGDDFETAALKEVEEETGLVISIDKVKQVRQMQTKSFDKITGMTNHALRRSFGYLFDGYVDDLMVEANAGAGFIEYPIASLQELSEGERSKFISAMVSDDNLALYEELSVAYGL